MSDFKWRHFRGEFILWAVRWYCKYGVSYRELEEMLTERGLKVDHTTIYRWVQHYAPQIEKRLRWHWKRNLGFSWRVDETYIKVKGKWVYLYRAIDKFGNTIDFYISSSRSTSAAKRFLSKAMSREKSWSKPPTINTDKNRSYGSAIKKMKAEGKCPSDLTHRQVKYLNNSIESDHSRLKRLVKPTLGFQSMRTAWRTICGFEVMRMFRKAQLDIWKKGEGVLGEVRLVNRQFGIDQI